MTRRDAGIIFWAAAGGYTLLFALWQLVTFAPLIWMFHGSMISGGDGLMYQAVFNLGLFLLLLSPVLLLHQRAALARWLFGEASRSSGADPGVSGAERVAALDLCVLVVAAVAIRLIVASLSDVGRWASRCLQVLMHPATLNSRTAEGLVLPIALLLGVLLMARRAAVAAWILRPGAGDVRRVPRLDVQRTGLRLFGLMLIFSSLPELLLAAAEGYGRSSHDPTSHSLLTGPWQLVLKPLLTMLLGVGLALGKDGLRAAWGRLRSQPSEEDRWEDEEDSSASGTKSSE